MNIIFFFSILIIGLSGIVAQVLLLRELLVSFYGNELTLGIILANWVILEAIGVFIIGRLIDKIKNKVDVFIIAQVVFSLMLPVSIYLSRVFKYISGIPQAEAIGLPTIFCASFLIILPVAFCHGALFSSGCKIYSLQVKEDNFSIGKVYIWETLGTVIGGIILTYIFIPHLNSFEIAFTVSLLGFLICFIFLKYLSGGKKFRYAILLLAASVLTLYLILSGSINDIQRLSINKQWDKQKVLDYRNSVYGNIAVTKKGEQFTFFYNGIPIITTPYPDITFVEEFAGLPLLFHKAPEDILIISAGAGGLINEILKHPIKRIDYAELDPLIIEMLKKYPSYLTKKELSDERVKILNLDGRFFVRTTPNKYDIILIGLSWPADLSTNRLFTKEFFSLLKKRLNQEGILAFWLPASITYLSQELKDLNACILNGLRDTYGYLRIIPGDYNIILASDARYILTQGAAQISQRISQRKLKISVLLPAYLNYRLDKTRLDWLRESLESATKKSNLDFMPFAVFQMLIYWNKQFSQSLAHFLQILQNLSLKLISVLIFLFTLLMLYLLYHKPDKFRKIGIIYSIATSGFFGMLISLILIFSFQIIYGYLYHKIGILISIFMSGIAVGSIFFIRQLARIKNNLKLFIMLEIVIALFSFILPFIIIWINNHPIHSYQIFLFLFFLSGLVIGLQFPLGTNIYLGKRDRIGETAGALFGADLTGSCIAGLFGGILFLPILGLFKTCLVIVLFKLSSISVLLVARGKMGRPKESRESR